jgi:hypothetical protein
MRNLDVIWDLRASRWSKKGQWFAFVSLVVLQGSHLLITARLQDRAADLDFDGDLVAVVVVVEFRVVNIYWEA